MNNREFWNSRYLNNPNLGSGVGSRGFLAIYKRALLESVLSLIDPCSILDIGCGDMVVSQALPRNQYTGIDISPAIIEFNKLMYLGRKFICGDFNAITVEKYDLVVCLDVLIHIPNKQDYSNFVKKIIEVTSGSGLIAAYENPPETISEITYYHEPITETLTKAGAVNLQKIGAYNQVCVFQFDKKANARPLIAPDENRKLKTPIFLVGSMRSGTTLLADLLGDSPDIAHCPFELKDIWSKFGNTKMASPKTGDTECPACFANHASPLIRANLIDAFLARISKLNNKNKDAVFLNKNPHLCNKLEFVDTLFPDARYIWIQRDLYSVVASLKRLFSDVYSRQKTWHWWPKPSGFTENRCWHASFEINTLSAIEKNRIFPGGSLKYLAEYWLESNRAVANFFSDIPKWKGIKVSEEALVICPHEQMARLFGLLQLPLFLGEVPPLDINRNTEWKDLLSPAEINELDNFVELRNAEIKDAVFNNGFLNLDLKAFQAAPIK